MYSQSKFIRAIFIFVAIFALAIAALADTIRLKDGSVIKGRIVSFENGEFVMLIGNGARQRRLTYRAEEVASITFDTNQNASTGQTRNENSENTTSPGFKKTTDGENTIITIGSSGKTNTPKSAPVTKRRPDPPADNNRAIETQKPDPIRISVKVLADETSNGWTNTGWVARRGQRFRITATGRISLGNGRNSTARGISSLPDSQKLMPDKPTGGIIAVVGDDNNDFIFVGENGEFIAQRDGALFLGINEGNLADNSGSFLVSIEIESDSGT